jgi:hypothetical protein
MKHLHDKVEKIDVRTAPPKEETAPSTDNSAAYGMGMMMTDTLMITNGGMGGYGGGYGAQGGIPDPYAQPPAAYGYGGGPTYGAPAYNNFGGNSGGYY